MDDSKVEWKLAEVEGYRLEETLSELSEAEFEIFSVQFTGQKWGVVARKFHKENVRNSMGFRKTI